MTTLSSARAWALTAAIVIAAILVAGVSIHRAISHPRTDDAEVVANLIGMAPQVDGPIRRLAVHDNQYVHAGDLLFEVDERPYQFALERALSDQSALEGQIEDQGRTIASQRDAVLVAKANVLNSDSNRKANSSAVDEAMASVRDAEAALLRAEADSRYAQSNLHRLEPLLAEQFVTADQVEQAQTLAETRKRAVDQARAQLVLSRARVITNQSRLEESQSTILQRRAQQRQAAHAVVTLAPLLNQREERSAAVRLARYNLNNCRVYAPFDGLVTNLTISEGAYVHTGVQVFTLIDARTWWVMANFRETQLRHIKVAMPAHLFLMAHESVSLDGVVESVGFGVTPDPSVVGTDAPGLPSVQRSLSWVHLAARYPVRIRVTTSSPGLLRVGETAVAVIYPDRKRDISQVKR